ncbi:MAG TPA: glutaredoxin family protein [Pyrinomonadaceae bacterium]|nr:glutaredoxin family protein [Pyrinomonadaceae bacterium]
MTSERGEALEVILYTVPNCPLCARTRSWLLRRGVRFTERDVANDFGALRAMYKLTRQNLVPVVQTADDALVRPSDEDLADLLDTDD